MVERAEFVRGFPFRQEGSICGWSELPKGGITFGLTVGEKQPTSSSLVMNEKGCPAKVIATAIGTAILMPMVRLVKDS